VSDPVSWFLIERGWEVVGADGESIGKVHEVVGDKERDIFDGLQVTARLVGEPRYVPSEEVGAITVGRVQLTAR
jgi:ribosomal 30S subunit maturation factor RimM